MLKFIENFLNTTSMYLLLVYYLLFLLAVGVALGFFGVVPYDPLFILFSATFITIICLLTNSAFAKAYSAPTNAESLYITALILALVISPPHSFVDGTYYELAFISSVIAMASKYIVAYHRKHLFNPAAFGVAATALILGVSATWWVGTSWMVPFVLLGGILVTKKVIRTDLVVSFIAVALITISVSRLVSGTPIFSIIERTILDTPLLFFAFVMLTEPLTTPPTRKLRVWYGSIVGFLFAPFVHVGIVYSTPELALLVGNIFSYVVSPKDRLLLQLKEKILVAADTYQFIFTTKLTAHFRSGQYLEWTLAHAHPDARGTRRYFTVASSPTENEIAIGVKFYPSSSSFKHNMLQLKSGDTVVASQLAGDFTMPKNKEMKLAFLAGGIGVTPFRSMVKYLVDTNEKRDIVLLYSNKTESDIAYRDIFSQGEAKLGMKVIYTLAPPQEVPESWKGKKGFIDAKLISTEISDFKSRLFYLSGPRSAVKAFEKALKELGVHQTHIKKDFFPGFV